MNLEFKKEEKSYINIGWKMNIPKFFFKTFTFVLSPLSQIDIKSEKVHNKNSCKTLK